MDSHAHAIRMAGRDPLYPKFITVCGCRVRITDWAPDAGATTFGIDVVCTLATRPELGLRCWDIRGRGEDGERTEIATAGRGAQTLQDFIWR